MMEIKPAEAMVATLSLGLTSVAFAITELATYGGSAYEIIMPLVGLAWVTSELRVRRARQQAEAGDEPEPDDPDRREGAAA